jgi:hypothetical protein
MLKILEIRALRIGQLVLSDDLQGRNYCDQPQTVASSSRFVHT